MIRNAGQTLASKNQRSNNCNFENPKRKAEFRRHPMNASFSMDVCSVEIQHVCLILPSLGSCGVISGSGCDIIFRSGCDCNGSGCDRLGIGYISEWTRSIKFADVYRRKEWTWFFVHYCRKTAVRLKYTKNKSRSSRYSHTT